MTNTRIACPNCQTTTTGPTSPTGWCAYCTIQACGDGDGDSAGLPTVADVDAAVAAFDRHLATCPGGCRCLAHRVASTRCSECGEDSDMFEPDDGHRVAGGFVLVGCEGYHTAALRAAALA